MKALVRPLRTMAQVQNATSISNRVPGPFVPHSTKATMPSTTATIPVDHSSFRGGAWGLGSRVLDQRGNAAPSDAGADTTHAGAAASPSRGTGRSRIRQ